MKDLQALRIYLRVAQLGGFSAAAREFGLAQSQVSRMIADLEQDLGAKLLSRSTRAVTMTEAGAEFLARLEPILAALEDAENSVRDTGELRGLLRVSTTTTMGMRVVMPRLAPFVERHPALQIELLLEDRWQDMVREGVDVGIRVGPLPDASGTSKLIATIRRIVVAAPSYLAWAGIPAKPDDLRSHRIVGGPAASRATSWQFQKGDTKVVVDLQPHISTNTVAGAVACVAGGLGITSTTIWACRDEIKNGTLVPVLADWEMADLPVNAYFPMGRSTRTVAKVFVDFIAEQLQTSDPSSDLPRHKTTRKNA